MAETATQLTLRDLMALTNADNIEILNELNEPLVELHGTNFVVPDKIHWLKDELLDRKVIEYGSGYENFITIKVEGKEDAV